MSVRIFEESLPLVRVERTSLIGRETVPDSWLQ